MQWPDDHIPTCPACGNESLGEENPPSGLCDECLAEAIALEISKDVKRPADWKQRVQIK